MSSKERDASLQELHINWLQGLDAIERLRDPWEILESTVQGRTVYATFDYVTSWYEAYALTRYTDFGEPLVGAIWTGSSLVGIAPLISSPSTLAGIPVRDLSLANYNLCAGELLLCDDRPETFETLIRSLVDRKGWDVLILSNVPATGQRLRIFENAADRAGLRWEVMDDHRYAVADLQGGYSAYATAKGSNFRKQAHRHAEKMAHAGTWRVNRLDGIPSPNTVSEYTDRMFAIAEAGWRAHMRGVEEERQHHPIYRMLLQKFAPRGMADLSILTINGQDAAYTLGLVERGIYYQVAIAYVDEMADFSPGSFLLLEVFRILPDLGVSLVVSHGDYEYKRRWASSIEETKKIILFAPTVRGALSWFAKFKLQRSWQRLRSRPTVVG